MAAYRIAGPLGLSQVKTVFDNGTLCLADSSLPGPLGMLLAKLILGVDFNSQAASAASTAGSTEPSSLSASEPEAKAIGQLSLSLAALLLLKQIETLRLKPYDDQTAKEISTWKTGATIGYGHLIKNTEWGIYKQGIQVTAAEMLLKKDLAPFEDAVNSKISVKLAQQQYDALVILAFNIGIHGFETSSVIKLINDSKAQTSYKSLEAAWKAWNKSQGKIMKGLENRRDCEWNIYTHGIYKKW